MKRTSRPADRARAARGRLTRRAATALAGATLASALLANEPFRPTLIVTVYAPVPESFEKTERAAAEFLQAIGPHLRNAFLSGD